MSYSTPAESQMRPRDIDSLSAGDFESGVKDNTSSMDYDSKVLNLSTGDFESGVKDNRSSMDYDSKVLNLSTGDFESGVKDNTSSMDYDSEVLDLSTGDAESGIKEHRNSLDYDLEVLDLSANSLSADKLHEPNNKSYIDHENSPISPKKNTWTRLKVENRQTLPKWWDGPEQVVVTILDNSTRNFNDTSNNQSEDALNLVKEEAIDCINNEVVSKNDKIRMDYSSVAEIANSPSIADNNTLKIEKAGNEVDALVIDDDSVPSERVVTTQVIDVENETFVDLTGDDDDDGQDDDDDIQIVSVEEPIRYLGSENRTPRKRKKRKLLFDGGDVVITEEPETSNVAGTSSLNKVRSRSPLLFRDLLDSTISIDDITDMTSSTSPLTTGLKKRRKLHNRHISPSLEQQVISDLSDNPHSDEIAQDLRNYEQSLRQAARTLYDIQVNEEFNDLAAVSLEPSSGRSSSSAGLLLKNMFFPTSRHRLSITADVTMPRVMPSRYLEKVPPLTGSNISSRPTQNLAPPLETIEIPDVSMTDDYSSSSQKNDVAPVVMPSTTGAQLSPNAGKLQNGELACPICFEPFSELKKNGRNMCSTICGHMFCKICLEESLRQCKQCPTCRKKLSKKQYHNIYLNFV